MTTTTAKTKDEIIAVLVAALAVAKGRSEATVRCEFGLDPVPSQPTEPSQPTDLGSRASAHGVPVRQEEMLLSA